MFGELLVEPYFWNKSPLWTLEDLFHQHTTSINGWRSATSDNQCHRC